MIFLQENFVFLYFKCYHLISKINLNENAYEDTSQQLHEKNH